ncbi:MAG: hypothetical protein AB7E60_12035 [Sphingobium sp.]
MSTHLSAALLGLAVLHIGVIMKLGGSFALHLIAIMAIGGFAIGARRLERRWMMLEAGGLPREAFARRCRRELLRFWVIGVMTACLWIPAALLYRALLG